MVPRSTASPKVPRERSGTCLARDSLHSGMASTTEAKKGTSRAEGAHSAAH